MNAIELRVKKCRLIEKMAENVKTAKNIGLQDVSSKGNWIKGIEL